MTTDSAAATMPPTPAPSAREIAKLLEGLCEALLERHGSDSWEGREATHRLNEVRAFLYGAPQQPSGAASGAVEPSPGGGSPQAHGLAIAAARAAVSDVYAQSVDVATVDHCLAAIDALPPTQPDPLCCFQIGDGLRLWGDRASVDRAARAIHEAEQVLPQVRRRLNAVAVAAAAASAPIAD